MNEAWDMSRDATANCCSFPACVSVSFPASVFESVLVFGFDRGKGKGKGRMGSRRICCVGRRAG